MEKQSFLKQMERAYAIARSGSITSYAAPVGTIRVKAKGDVAKVAADLHPLAVRIGNDFIISDVDVKGPSSPPEVVMEVSISSNDVEVFYYGFDHPTNYVDGEFGYESVQVGGVLFKIIEDDLGVVKSVFF